ncbi:MAG: hypothetical protein HYS61_09220, partial [Acidobacteria bacterium]|nr:hypothetical protein [Acidobacteriota bacterium]
MKRRSFLKLSAVGLSGICASAFTAAGVPESRVTTVLGPIAPRKLGRTLMHEHVLVDFVGADKIAPGVSAASWSRTMP